jgi:hypothetical protein
MITDDQWRRFGQSRWMDRTRRFPFRMVWIGLTGVLIAIGILVLLVVLAPKPPVQLIFESRIALGQLRRSDAETYVPELEKKADANWSKTIQSWRTENRKWLLNRNFSSVRSWAQKTRDSAREALRQSNITRESLRVETQAKIALLENSIQNFETQYRHLPMNPGLRDRYVKAELDLFEAQKIARRGDYKKALVILNQCEDRIGEAGSGASTILTDYFRNWSLWRQWAQETIAWSKNEEKTAILIDKIGHVCRIYQNGDLAAEYNVDLGPNWIGHKRKQNDGATPEGRYFIRRKKQNGETQYYKALEIDYPNERDQSLFDAAKQQGRIPMSAKIGGLIEIHGNGGQGANWTQGCVALADRDMDRLFDMTDVGTPVTIVGSLTQLSRLNSNNHYSKWN